jgi:hypothetical protein
MRAFFESGQVIDLALVVIVLEAIFLVVRRARSAEGLKPIEVFGQLAAGVCLLSAVRCALTGADWRWTAGFLSASFPAHVFDLVRRARRAA